MGGCRILRPRYVQWPRADVWGWPHRSIMRAALVTAQKPDVLHAHFAYPCGLAGVGVARSWGIPSVLTLHGSDVNRYPHVNALARRRFGQAIHMANFVMTVSDMLAEHTERLSGRRPQMRPIGIDLRRYDKLPDQQTARESLGLPIDKRVVLFVGNLLSAKGIPELLEALSVPTLRDVLGVFVGEGPMRAAIQQSPVARAEGAQPNEKIPLYLAAADLFVLPSHSEGMPTVLIEAGAASVPVIATSVGGISELLAEGRGWLIPPHRPDALACAIAEALEDRDSARVRAERLRRYVWEHYDADANARSLLDVYRSLVGEVAQVRIEV